MRLEGQIIDGTGRPGYYGAVVTEGDKIVAVEELPTPPEPESLKLITPGFIDAHTHSDAYLLIEPDAPSKLTQGITTEINGQCGGSIAPRYGEARLSSDWKAILGDRLTWHTLAEYRAVFEQARPAVNSVEFIGHNTLRSSVIGYQNRRADADDMRRMKYLLEEALEQGGWGLTTGLIYPPGKYSTSEEVEALASVAAAHGGLYATHMRSEGDQLLEAIDEVLALVRKTDIRAEISHFKTSGEQNWHKLDAALGKLERAIDAGEILGSDRYPYCAAGTDLDVVMNDDGTIDERDWSKVMVGGTWHADNKRFSGKWVSEIAAPDEEAKLVREIIEKDGHKTGAFFFTMSEENLKRIYAQSWIIPGTDASLRAPWGPLGEDWPHPRAYATMPEFYRMVRALGNSREATIARMTSAPARRFGLKGRGVIEQGAYADLLVIDEPNFKATASYAQPHSFTTGVCLVMVNGVVSYQDGKFTGNRNGRFLERNGL